MKKILLSTLLAASLATASDYNFEVTPMIGGNFTEGNLSLEEDYANIGIAFGINVDSTYLDQIEIGFLKTLDRVNYDNSNLETTIVRNFINVVKNYKVNEEVSLYALAGIGYETFSKEAFNNEDSPFGNYGVGLKYNITDNFALKTDLRHVIETDHGDNNLLYNLGFAMSFGEKAKPVPPVKEKSITLIEQEETFPHPKDSDNDGVIDPNDLCPDTPEGVLVDKDGCTILINLDINFDFDSAEIKDQYNPKITEFAELLNKDTTLKATINAHTDSDGSEKYNQKLSERRAQSAVDALKELNVDEKRLTAKGYGETQPIATNDTEEGKAANRRVNASLQRTK